MQRILDWSAAIDDGGTVVPPPSIEDIDQAESRVRPFIRHTPVLTSRSLDAETGGQLYFKCENFQRSGSFKARGAFNAVLARGPDVTTIATHSSGNHAAAVALAASTEGLKAHVVMPKTAPKAKRSAVEAAGAEIISCEPTLDSRERTLAEVALRTGAAIIPPFDSTLVAAGQGTCALELVADVSKPLDLVLLPVGGGGLLAGTLIALAARSPHTRVIGVEPALADDAARGFREARRQPQVLPVATIADGVTTAMSDMTFSVMCWLAHDIVTVSEDSIVKAMRLIWERLKIVVEPTCALPLAAILEGAVDVRGKSVGLILTGGNVDLDRLPWMA
jgi:threonine dehydratase